MSKPSCILAIDAGGTFLKAALVDMSKNIITGSFIRIPVISNGTLCEIEGAYQQLLALAVQFASVQQLEIAAIGVCTPGPFDYKNGVSLMQHKYAAIYNRSPIPWLTGKLPETPVYFLHDANAFLLGSLEQSATLNQYKRIAGVTLGTGLGFATFFDGKLNENSTGGPGISIYARPFANGFAEDYASRKAILRYYAELRGENNLDVIDIAKLATEKQDGAAITAFEQFGKALGNILRPVVEEHRINALIFGGAISKSWNLFSQPLYSTLSGIDAIQTICPAENMDYAPIIGSASFALNKAQK